jgi:hypothetical protein
MNEERKRVLDLLEDCFPEPSHPTIDELRSRPPDELNGWNSQNLAHQAVHEYDPYFREQFALGVCEKLLDGAAMTVPERAWLIYVLKNAGTAITKKARVFPNNLPNEYKGRAPTPPLDKVALMLSLGIAMETDGGSKRDAVQRLTNAAKSMNKGYETVRAIYYSPNYKWFSETDFFKRWISKPPADIYAPMKASER